MAIYEFRGKWRGLSNFAPCPAGIYCPGAWGSFPTVEHAYQAAKTQDGEWQDRIRKARTPGSSKRMTRSPQFPIREDWDSRKLWVMENLLRQKFSTKAYAELLLSTGSEELVEGNHWHDNFWGCCQCYHCYTLPADNSNHLGKLLMKIREELRSNQGAFGL